MRIQTRSIVSVLVPSLLCCGIAIATQPASVADDTAVVAKQGAPPAKAAKTSGVPPGLAKKFGPTVPEKAYIAIDPQYTDRAYFLIGGQWVLQQNFTPDVQVEVRSLFVLPPVPEPPPVPLPSVAVSFHVVLLS